MWMNFRTFLWFIGRPSLSPEMFRRLRWYLTHPRTPRSHRESQKLLSAQWCASAAVSREEFLSDIGFRGELEKVSGIHPEIWRRAEQAAAACPVPMGGGGEVDLL